MPTSVYLLFDERMALHRPIGSQSVDLSRLYEQDAEILKKLVNFDAERPARIYALYHALKSLENRFHQQCFVPLPCLPASKETICLAHSSDHYERLFATSQLPDDKLKELDVENDLYFCRHTFDAACLAAGGVVQSVNAVTDAFRTGVGSTRAIALVRPPGHHALKDSPMGFCYFNNIAIAAKHAVHTGRARRVFILDWDIHHGNGIQDITYDDPSIFYTSIHRGDSDTDTFYPSTGKHHETGRSNGAGSNLNIVWGRNGMGNTEYAGAFAELILPVLSSFNPDLIIIGCGLDAAKGDLLGDCGLTPQMYYAMTESLLEEVGQEIPVVVALEGGYNLKVISKCMQAVALALLDEPFEENTESIALSDFWLPGQTRGSFDERKGHMKSKQKAAIDSIKRSARALAQSRLHQSAPINKIRQTVPTAAYAPVSEFKERCHRLSLSESDRYPAKKKVVLRASEEGYLDAA